MKSLFKLSMGLVALALAQQASAASYTVRVTGATAFRAATHKAIVNFLGGNASTGIPVRMAHSGNTVGGSASTSGGTSTLAEGSNYATYIGTNGSDTYTIQATFTGSVEGIRDVGQAIAIPFIPASEVPAGTGFDLAKRLGQATSTTAPTNATEIAVANMAFSDVAKSSTDYATVDLNTPDVAGIIPFIWVANRGSTLTNITPLQARALLTNGVIRKNLITGLLADDPELTPATGGWAVLTGRNSLSGTRVATLAETQHGVFTSVQQYKLGTTSGTKPGSNPQITSLELWPNTGAASTGDDALLGNGGYTSGSGVSAAMGWQGASVNLFFKDEDANTVPLKTGVKVDLVGYAGVSDASTAVDATNLGTRLSYNGVSYVGQADNAKVIYGQYSFWSNELLYTKGTLSTGDTTFKTALLTFFNTQSNIGSSAVSRDSMKVNRQTDGALIGF